MRSEVVASAATEIATIGANRVSEKWSGMNSVEYPRSSILRACARHDAASTSPCVWTPNRNVRGCANSGSRELGDDRSERVHLLDRHHVIAHVPARAPPLERLDHLIDGADEDRRAVEHLLGGRLERARHHLLQLARVVGEVHEAGERLDLEVGEARAG